jgi:hypothetical protein
LNAIASIIGIHYLGVAPACKIVSVNIFEDGEDDTPDSSLLDAVKWIFQEIERQGQQNRAVINISIAGGVAPPFINLEALINKEATRLNVLVAYAAGNDGVRLILQLDFT